MITQPRQTIAPHCNGTLRLAGLVVSPYFQLANTRKVGADSVRDIRLKKSLMAVDRAIIDLISAGNDPAQLAIEAHFMDGTTEVELYNIFYDGSTIENGTNYATLAEAAINAHAVGSGYTVPLVNGIIWPTMTVPQVKALIAASVPAAPSSYQTIVSQTGTAAPAVSGSLSPMSTYPTGTTFTWARTSAGVYTLTASAAVFNTSGKTGVFVGPLQNLNASIRAVVTSTTVITVTTAVQSVAILGLLGLTATATDALLSQTMLYVQTYP